jgi:predicted aminopeptidase
MVNLPPKDSVPNENEFEADIQWRPQWKFLKGLWFRVRYANVHQYQGPKNVDQKQTKEQLEALGRQVVALKDYARLAQVRFDEGYTSYLEVLDTNRRLFNAELTQAQTKAILFGSFVNLFKAMGGGWVVEADNMTVQGNP